MDFISALFDRFDNLIDFIPVSQSTKLPNFVCEVCPSVCILELLVIKSRNMYNSYQLDFQNPTLVAVSAKHFE